ncbi:metallophosphoesterase family protein [Variovorax ureilyticus]|uniref:Phosphoesterase n=1 Tax=Variovorax ureilyticus TaxID=1836198 RepID=A0ABU8VQA3_9BURK
MRRIGLISDTHGLLRPEASAFLHGCDHIIHGGDICEQRILDELAAIATLTVVRGNNDMGAWAKDIPETASFEIDGVRFYAIHNLAELPIDPVASGIRVVVSGHSHRPQAKERDGVLYINPGSAVPRRFKLPISAGELLLDDGTMTPRIVELVTR